MKKSFVKIIAVALTTVMICSLVSCDLFKTPHTHDYSEIGSNKTHHWNYCPDDQEKDDSSREKHYDKDLDGKCDVCGYEVELPHVHNYSEWGSDADNHWKYCPDDNAKDESTVAPHADDNNDGKCDACGQDMAAPVEESVSIEIIEGVPTLIVKGPLYEEAGCVKLHADGNGAHSYWNNTSKFKSAYEFKVPLSDLALTDTPWYFFHIYAYKNTNPASLDKYDAKMDLPRGTIEIGATYEYDGVIYEIKQEGNTEQLVIQPKPAPLTEVESITVELDENGKPILVVKGVLSSKAVCIKLHADADTDDGKQHYFADNVSAETGKFEFRFDMTQVPTKSGGATWAWFHIYSYNTSDPTNLTSYAEKFDLMRGNFLADDAGHEYSGVKYTFAASSESWGMIAFKVEKA